MINTDDMQVSYVKTTSRKFGKIYVALFERENEPARAAIRVHGTASGALAYGMNVLIRLRRLQEAMRKTEPTA